MSALPTAWAELEAAVNGRTFFGMRGVRDPDNRCDDFTATGYDGTGTCHSDGHFMCVECAHLSPEAPRFVDHERAGRGDRLRLFWDRPGGPLAR